ncbi:oligosaccharide repeat unit polymerase [bacterium]|nr:MAG: oligosaccharide repeat unit polymerase [bacterium]
MFIPFKVLWWGSMGIQFGLLYLVHRLARRPEWPLLSVRNLVQPNYWMIAFWFLGFTVPQLLYPLNDYPVLGMEMASVTERAWASLAANWCLIQYGGGAVLGFWLMKFFTPKEIPRLLELRPVKNRELWVTGFFTILGFIGFLYLFITFRGSGGPRSDLVKNLPGKIAYATSFFFTSGASIFIAHYIIQNKKGAGYTIAILTAVFMFFLGGRGRVLWPSVLTICFLGMASGRKAKPVAVVVAGIFMYTLLAIMDPLLFLLEDGNGAMFLERSLQYASVKDIMLNRLFNSYTNIPLTIYYDDIPHKWQYVYNSQGGVQWMLRFFPQVLQQGVGFNQSVPLEWFLAFSYKGFFLGGIFLGVMLGGMRIIFLKTHNPFVMWSYFLAVQWVTSVNGTFFQAYEKIISATVPPLFVYALANIRWRAPEPVVSDGTPTLVPESGAS